MQSKRRVEQYEHKDDHVTASCHAVFCDDQLTVFTSYATLPSSTHAPATVAAAAAAAAAAAV